MNGTEARHLPVRYSNKNMLRLTPIFVLPGHRSFKPRFSCAYFKPNLLGGGIVVVGLHTATAVPGLIPGVDFFKCSHRFSISVSVYPAQFAC